MKKNKIRLTESQLHQVIKESVRHILSEMEGSSSCSSYAYDYDSDSVYRNTGGAGRGNELDQMYDSEQAYKEAEAKKQIERDREERLRKEGSWY